ncbi:hypothetical protein [Streptomyces sp. NPDC056660]|uniref:hypothetical protein n=1 Tax=Streptomyces sp. NPDC056660 TaxID=3345897 RepID=UPI0036A2E9C3
MNDGLMLPVSRLRHITGFITTYGEEADPRVSVFARIWHVQRVAFVARRLHDRLESLDRSRIERLVWWHDLNRWPFAHNSERGNFDQAENVREYFSSLPGCTERDMLDLYGIHKKDPTTLTQEAQIVLVADLLAGIVEDPVMAVAGLNVHPRFIPREVEGLLGFSLCKDPWRVKCADLAAELHGGPHPSPEGFQVRLRTLFAELVEEILNTHWRKDPAATMATFIDIAGAVRNSFISPVIFPLNNEKVCHASWLRHEVIPWYLENIYDARRRLLVIDERTFVADVIGIPGSPYASDHFRPDLGYVSREEPAMAFIHPGTTAKPVS